MSILTPAMKKYRDQLAADNSNCKLWFPFNEVSGAEINDVIGGVVDTPDTIAYTEPHAIEAAKVGAAVTSGNLPKLDKNLIFVASLKVETAESFLNFKLGTTTHVGISSGVATIDVGIGAGNGAQTPTLAIGSVAGDVVTLAAVVVGDTLYHYASINGAGILEHASVDASGYVAAFDDIDALLNNDTTYSIAIAQQIYGIALFTFDKDMFSTTEIIAALDEIDGNWQNGKKYLPESIL